MSNVIQFHSSKDKLGKKAPPLINWGFPTDSAFLRHIVGSNASARDFFREFIDLWERARSKIERGDKKWLVWSRRDWAALGGLSEGQFRNDALRILKERRLISSQAMKLNPNGVKQLGLSLEEDRLIELIKEAIGELDVHDDSVEKAHTNRGAIAAWRRSKILQFYDRRTEAKEAAE